MDTQAAKFDWTALRQRLETAQAALERSLTPDAEETRRILAARADRLRRVTTNAVAGDLEIVEFVLAHERHAFESRHVRVVHPLEQLTPIPCTPPFVLGIVSLRGEILSVIDIRRFFDLPIQGLSDLNKVIVLEAGAMRCGVLADAIVGVRRVASADFQAALPTLTDRRADYLAGITPERTVVLDAAKLLGDPRIVVDEQVAA